MKILYVITQADGGGAQKYVLQLAKAFSGEIAVGPDGSGLEVAAAAIGITVHRLRHLKRNISPEHDLLAILELLQLVRKLDPDIVHLNSSKAGFIGSMIRPFVRAKIVFTAHGFVFLEPLPRFTKFLYKNLERLASVGRHQIIAVSESDRQAAIQNYVARPAKIVTIHNGSPEIELLDPAAARSNLSIPSDRLAVACIANFYRTKGLDALINALSMLPADIREQVHCYVFGDGELRPDLSALITALDLKTVHLLGRVENAAALLPAFNFAVLPSRKEGFPYAALEYLRAGLYTVATRAGGTPEALGDAALYVAPEDPAALAKALEQVARVYLSPDVAQPRRLSHLALQQAKQFSETRMVEHTRAVYNRLLKH